ncbi:hypothetical protein F0562_027802 [Nyssa sinensis]|uniref:Tify domain-containing protein n=1 Tax=Nyssa sinensis TaxID=561372 RepID=A0A5J5B6J7_9ASTE|nr:hypothetical protein F0562_027802 [Nyssa sinensis]
MHSVSIPEPKPPVFGDTRPLNVPNQFAEDEDDATAGGESIDNAHVPNEAHVRDEVPSDAIYADCGSDIFVHRSDPTNQLTLSFGGQVYLFDSITTDKVQAVPFRLGDMKLHKVRN